MEDQTKKKMGRPPVGHRRSFHCPADLHLLIRLLAAINNQSLSDVIRDGTEQYVTQQLNAHRETLRTMTWDKPELQQAAEEFLGDQK